MLFQIIQISPDGLYGDIEMSGKSSGIHHFVALEHIDDLHLA